MDFKLGDHIRSEKMEVEGVILNISDPAKIPVCKGIMVIRLYCTLDATWPLAVNKSVEMSIETKHWRVTK